MQRYHYGVYAGKSDGNMPMDVLRPTMHEAASLSKCGHRVSCYAVAECALLGELARGSVKPQGLLTYGEFGLQRERALFGTLWMASDVFD